MLNKLTCMPATLHILTLGPLQKLEPVTSLAQIVEKTIANGKRASIKCVEAQEIDTAARKLFVDEFAPMPTKLVLGKLSSGTSVGRKNKLMYSYRDGAPSAPSGSSGPKQQHVRGWFYSDQASQRPSDRLQSPNNSRGDQPGRATPCHSPDSRAASASED